MRHRIGLRREDKNAWERRVALTPGDVEHLRARGIEVWVERFDRRCFSDEEYLEAGARLVDDVRPCEVVLGIKEMPLGWFREGGAYVFFSHTVKGQPFNMPMLADLSRKHCTLFDYELVTDDDGRRLIYFSRHAGMAGMIDSLWTLGRRLRILGVESPFLHVEPAHRYRDLEDALRAVRRVARHIEQDGLPRTHLPLVIGLTGAGNVAAGVQEVLDLLPCEEIAPRELETWVHAHRDLRDRVGMVRLCQEHLVQRREHPERFDKQEYYDRPDLYRAALVPWLRHLSLLVHGVYWDERYPVFVSREDLRRLFDREGAPRLIAVGDITCDVQGSLACTVRETEPGNPVYVYDPATGETRDGFEGPGFAVMAVGNLPSELPLEASRDFARALMPLVPALAGLDLDADFERASMPAALRRAVILWKGELTPEHGHLREFIEPHGPGPGPESGGDRA